MKSSRDHLHDVCQVIFHPEASWCKIQWNVHQCEAGKGPPMSTLPSVPSAVSSIGPDFMTLKVSATPQMNMACWVTSLVSALSSIAMENATNYFISRLDRQFQMHPRVRNPICLVKGLNLRSLKRVTTDCRFFRAGNNAHAFSIHCCPSGFSHLSAWRVSERWQSLFSFGTDSCCQHCKHTAGPPSLP